MKKILLLSVFLLVCLSTVGCNSSTNTSEQQQITEKTEEVTRSKASETPIQDEKENQTEDSYIEPVQATDREEEDDIELKFNELPAQGDYEVYLDGEMIETEDAIIVEGHSNLIPGARVVGEVTVFKKNIEYFLDRSTEEYSFRADSTEIVDEDGNFKITLEHPKMNKKTFVSVKFLLDGQQNDDVFRHYGDRGQNLVGPFIYKHQGKAGGRGPEDIFNKAEVSTSFTPNQNDKAIRRFEEPQWHEIPNDLGDTRVWIEVDEINDDGEFFYISGRSNLIEGSRLAIKRDFITAETYVMKDGSFHFTFDYEYKEDSPFIIIFDPNDYQWNIVEETYGAKGQKLVGDLVTTNKYNNKQRIEYVIEEKSQEIKVPDNIELKMDGSEATLLVPDEVLFDFGKYQLKESSQKTLDELSETLKNAFNKKNLDVVINGHTDNVGGISNQKLSENRANEVKKYLEKKLVGSTINFSINGYGASKPIASNDTESGRAKNRRVEIVVKLK